MSGIPVGYELPPADTAPGPRGWKALPFENATKYERRRAVAEHKSPKWFGMEKKTQLRHLRQECHADLLVEMPQRAEKDNCCGIPIS